MPTYRITSPDGKTYRVTGPAGSTKEQALAKVKAQLTAAPVAVEPAPISTADIGRGILKGATLNFGDELRGGASAALGALTGQGSFSDLYGATRDYERGQSEQFGQDHPVAATGSEIVGGLGTGLLGGIKAAGTTLGKAAAARMASTGLLGRLGLSSGLGAAGGAATGAIAGAGGAEELGDVPMEATKGSVIGGITGGLLGGATEGVRTGYRAGKEALTRARDPAYQSARNMSKVVQRSGMSGQDALLRAGAMGPDGTLADTSEAAKEMLESVTNQPGAARGNALKQLEARSRRQGPDLLSDLGPGKKYETLAALKAHRKEVASPLYKKAFADGVPHTESLETIFNDIEEFAPGLWAKSKKLGKLSLANKGQKIGDLGDARPSLEGWQYLKEKLDDTVDSMRRSGDNKAAGAVAATRARLLNELDELNPGYKQARGEWAGTKQFEDMIESAGKFMTMPASEFEEVAKGLSKVDRQALRIGAIQAIEDRLERSAWTHDVAKFFRTPAMTRKMKLLFDDPKDYVDFSNKLTASTAKQKTFDAVRGNSATTKRLAAAADSNDWISSAMDSFVDLSMNPVSGSVNAARKGLLAVGQKVAGFRPGMSEAARTETARMLLETDPAMRQLQSQINRGLLNAPPPNFRMPLLPAGVGLLSGQLAGSRK